MPFAHSRTEILIGKTALQRLREKTVMVIGLGGVGAHCADALVRAGVGTMIIIDHDVITPSNLNRQLLALHSTLGQKKTQLMQERLLDIAPSLKLHVVDKFINTGDVDALLDEYQIDFIADCIDSITVKAALVRSAQQRKIAIISAMGAGNRLQATALKIKNLNQSNTCPLARQLRYQLRKIDGDLAYPVVISEEHGKKALAHQKINGESARAINGTISYMPPLFAMMMSAYIIDKLIVAP